MNPHEPQLTCRDESIAQGTWRSLPQSITTMGDEMGHDARETEDVATWGDLRTEWRSLERDWALQLCRGEHFYL